MIDRENDKVVFGKEDLVRLDRLPSAIVSDAIILKSPRSGIFVRLFKFFVFLLVLGSLLIGGSLLALENGFLDDTLTARATSALGEAAGEGVSAKVATTRLRLVDATTLALQAQGVVLTDVATGNPVLSADHIDLALDPIALLQGTLSIASVDIGSAEIDARLLASDKPFNADMLRVDTLPFLIETAYGWADKFALRLAESPTARFTLASLKITLPAASGFAAPVELRDGRFVHDGSDRVAVTGQVVSGAVRASLAFSVALAEGKVSGIDIDLIGLPLSPFLLRQSKLTAGPQSGIDAPLTVAIKTRRTGKLAAPDFAAHAKIGKGLFWSDRISQEITGAEFHFRYDGTARTLAFDKSEIKLGPSRIPLEGAIIDLDRVDGESAKGFAFDLLVENAIVASQDSGEAPLRFHAKASAYYQRETRQLTVTPISVTTPLGNIAATLGVTFGSASPEISFSMRSAELGSAAVKQLWPFWVAKGSRRWVHANLFSGMVRDGEVDVLIPAGGIVEGEPVILGEKELSIRFDVVGTRFNFLGDIPPARNANGRFEQAGGKVKVTVPSGEIFLNSGQSVSISAAELTLADVYEKPLMADIQLKATGSAQAIAELSTFRPIEALQKTEFKPTDFSGAVTASVSARFGLIAAQEPPKPEWNAKLMLEDVSLLREIFGRTIAGLQGSLEIGAKGIRLESDAKVDGIPFKLALSQALSDPKGDQRRFSLTGKLDRNDLSKFVPGLTEFIDGRIGIRIEADTKGNQRVEADLSNATLSVPWIGWRKGVGIAAKTSFTAQLKDGVTRISKFQLRGDGFGAEGDLVSDKDGLVSAKFSQVQLTPSDRYQMSIKRGDAGLSIDVRGNVADLRPVLVTLKGGSGEDRKSEKAFRLALKLDSAIGYNKERLSNLDVKVSTSKGRINTLTLSAITESGEAVVARKDDGEKVIDITSGDAGALGRFADVYRNMTGGLLNIKLRARGASGWRGSVDIRNFALINEQRLKSIVSTPATDDGRSLNDAVRREIDVTSQKFRRGFAHVMIDGSAIRVENGVVRGDQVGATFQGAIRDENNRMEMTGTFMPAYGLNRLFAELPLIGAILGNGKDRGLLGITFKLSGPVENPKLSINPLSLIAPGVFRNIFEFE